MIEADAIAKKYKLENFKELNVKNAPNGVCKIDEPDTITRWYRPEHMDVMISNIVRFCPIHRRSVAIRVCITRKEEREALTKEGLNNLIEFKIRNGYLDLNKAWYANGCAFDKPELWEKYSYE